MSEAEQKPIAPPTRVMNISHRYEYRTDENESASQAHIVEKEGVLWLTNIYSHKDHRKQGLTRQLIDRALDDWGHRDIYLSVEPYVDAPMPADALHRYYASFGFVATEVPGVLVRKGK